MEIILKVSVAGLVLAVGLRYLREIKSDLVSIVLIVFSIILTGFLVFQMKMFVDFILWIQEMLPSIPWQHLKLVIKILLISLTVSIIISYCKDLGETHVATMIELITSIILVTMCIPILKELLVLIFNLLDKMGGK